MLKEKVLDELKLKQEEFNKKKKIMRKLNKEIVDEAKDILKTMNKLKDVYPVPFKMSGSSKCPKCTNVLKITKAETFFSRYYLYNCNKCGYEYVEKQKITMTILEGEVNN